MYRSELNSSLPIDGSLSKAGAPAIAVLSRIADALPREETVTVAGFDTFVCKARLACPARNPDSGRTAAITATQARAFVAPNLCAMALADSARNDEIYAGTAIGYDDRDPFLLGRGSAKYGNNY